MVIRLGAGRISWGEGFLDPSDMERGCLDKEQNHFLFAYDQNRDHFHQFRNSHQHYHHH